MAEYEWLVADYHLPMTYSCRMPLSSPFSAQVLPVPGPSTVQLALLRVAMELYGYMQTRDVIFPIIRKLDVYVRPPQSIGVSTHVLRAYKANSNYQLDETIGYREFAHAEGVITIFLKAPKTQRSLLTELLQAIGYWGQACSLASCVKVYKAEPDLEQVIQPLSRMNAAALSYVTAFVTEWNVDLATWETIMSNSDNYKPILRPVLYVFPLRVGERFSMSFRLLSCSLE